MAANSNIAVLTSRLTQPGPSSSKRVDSDGSDIDEEELFAQLEAEIENDSDIALRERGLEKIKRE